MADSTLLPSGLDMAGWEHPFIDLDFIQAQWQKFPEAEVVQRCSASTFVPLLLLSLVRSLVPPRVSMTIEIK